MTSPRLPIVLFPACLGGEALAAWKIMTAPMTRKANLPNSTRLAMSPVIIDRRWFAIGYAGLSGTESDRLL